jgi:hypothetical protein
MNMKKQINMCLLMFMKCILIDIKFNIDQNNDELLKTICKHKKNLKSQLSLIVC